MNPTNSMINLNKKDVKKKKKINYHSYTEKEQGVTRLRRKFVPLKKVTKTSPPHTSIKRQLNSL